MTAVVARRRGPRVWAVVVGLAVLAFAAMIVTVTITIGIWPGELKLFAPLFCSDAQPDAFVVSDSTSVRPGETIWEFTLYCMGPNGDVTDEGFAGPLMAAMLVHGLIVLGVVGIVRAMWRRRRARSRRRAASSELIGVAR